MRKSSKGNNKKCLAISMCRITSWCCYAGLHENEVTRRDARDSSGPRPIVLEELPYCFVHSETIPPNVPLGQYVHRKLRDKQLDEMRALKE